MNVVAFCLDGIANSNIQLCIPCSRHFPNEAQTLVLYASNAGMQDLDSIAQGGIMRILRAAATAQGCVLCGCFEKQAKVSPARPQQLQCVQQV